MLEKPRLNVTLLTGRTREQGVGKEKGKSSKDYVESVSICHIDPADLKKLGIKDKTNVLITTPYGSVVLKGVKSPRAPHPGVIFIPYSPWANVLVNPETDSIGMPSFKGIRASVEPAPDEPVLSMEALLKAQYGKGQHANH